MYYIEKNLTRLRNGQFTFFLNPKELNEVKSKLKKDEYSIFYPYKDSEKNIIYNRNMPNIILYEIKCNIELRHQDILGSIYSLNISGELFGDVLIIDGHYYVYVLDIIRNYFETNFLMIKNARIQLIELPISTLENYERAYEELEFIVSSNRIDTIVSSIIHTGRNNISDLLKKKEIILNYDFLKNTSYKLREGDTFSIKRVGKYKYNGIIKNTKSNNLIVSIYKYL